LTFIWYETAIEVASISGSFKLYIFIEYQGAIKGKLNIHLSATLSKSNLGKRCIGESITHTLSEMCPYAGISPTKNET
jgi:hypothetical protein